MKIRLFPLLQHLICHLCQLEKIEEVLFTWDGIWRQQWKGPKSQEVSNASQSFLRIFKRINRHIFEPQGEEFSDGPSKSGWRYPVSISLTLLAKANNLKIFSSMEYTTSCVSKNKPRVISHWNLDFLIFNTFFKIKITFCGWYKRSSVV